VGPGGYQGRRSEVRRARKRWGDLALLDELCTPDMVSHALARDRPQGVEGTRQFCERLSPSPPRSLDPFVVAEGNMVVQFGHRELDYPGGSFLDF